MVGEHHEENEEEYPKVRLDQFEHILSKFASMVSQLLVVKCKETSSIEACHEGPKKK
jgi:hypothetical protein